MTDQPAPSFAGTPAAGSRHSVPDRIATLVLFGATGDLARRMLFPALAHLDADGLLPDDLVIIGSGRSALSAEAFRAQVADALGALPADRRPAEAAVPRFLARLDYVAIDVGAGEGMAGLRTVLGERAGARLGVYCSTPPALFGPIAEGLAAEGLACAHCRFAMEKPIGHDLASSRAVNDTIGRVFAEEATFRIDHYLGKETVQNLLALRFANAMFEPLWNATAIDHVQITVAETVGLEGRVSYYDGVGALRDMVQNHMLQLLAMVAMEPPAAYTPTAVRDEKVKLLRALRPINAHSARATSVLGQYAAGTCDGMSVAGYADELGAASATETFVALKVHIDNWRWKAVPFYLRTGKRMPARKSEVIIRFRPVPHDIFGGAERGRPLTANTLVINLQPEDAVELRIMAKQPGLDRDGVRLGEIALDVALPTGAGGRRRIAYERLLLDFIEGDQTLFVRRDEVEAQWAFIDAVRDAWRAAGLSPAPYPAGTPGPTAAIALIERDGASWQE